MIDKISVLLSAKTLEFRFFIISKASTPFSSSQLFKFITRSHLSCLTELFSGSLIHFLAGLPKTSNTLLTQKSQILTIASSGIWYRKSHSYFELFHAFCSMYRPNFFASRRRRRYSRQLFWSNCVVSITRSRTFIFLSLTRRSTSYTPLPGHYIPR